MDVSVSPSVLLQPAGHLVRSMENPSGPVTFVPSVDVPQWLSSIRLTTASRWSFQRASHAPIDAGDEVDVPVAAVVDAADGADVAAADVAVAALSPSSPPQAATTAATPRIPSTDAAARGPHMPPSPPPQAPRPNRPYGTPQNRVASPAPPGC